MKEIKRDKVKSILGLPDSIQYEDYYTIITNIKNKYDKRGMKKSLKEWDMFLWQWAKELEHEWEQGNNL